MIAAVVLLALILILLLALLLRRAPDPSAALDELSVLHRMQLQQQRELRTELGVQARDHRLEQSAAQLELGRDSEVRLEALRESTEIRLQAVRDTLERGLRELQRDNSAKLDEMRRTVDEKLHATLEARLNASFRLVSERLEQVHKGLGEMQALASDVGDLKRVLSNVKTRGTWGEVQLAALLEQLLIPEQYAANVVTVPGSAERVEFAIRLPGGGDAPVWLPIDAKFPREDYERLAQAQERADPAAAEAAARQLEQRLRLEARTIRDK
ncbi:MAG: DNA recombination protein RmuC, partial [Burkholderiaceae bacterium]